MCMFFSITRKFSLFLAEHIKDYDVIYHFLMIRIKEITLWMNWTVFFVFVHKLHTLNQFKDVA